MSHHTSSTEQPLPPRIYLSPPDLGGQELRFVQEGFDTNWIAPLGPNVDGSLPSSCIKA